MHTNHYNLLKKVQLVYIIAGEAIKFFNKDLPEEKRKNGLRICFVDQETREDVLNMCVGVFPIEKSKKYFSWSREIAKIVSGEDAPLTTFGYSIDVPQGGVRGFRYGVGVSGQKSSTSEVIAAAIIFIVEKTMECEFLLEPSKEECFFELKTEFDKPGRNENFNKFMDYLINEQGIFKQIEFMESMK